MAIGEKRWSSGPRGEPAAAGRAMPREASIARASGLPGAGSPATPLVVSGAWGAEVLDALVVVRRGNRLSILPVSDPCAERIFSLLGLEPDA